MTQPQPELVDLYRAGLKGAVDWMKVSLESAERMQNQQLIAIRSALDAQVKSATELGGAKTLDELLALQTRMAEAQMQGLLGFWTSFYENQVAAFSAASRDKTAAR
jgi:phasin family protein